MSRVKARTDAEDLQDALRMPYLHGRCTALALALHRRTGWPLWSVWAGGTLAHVGVRDPEGAFIDVRGRIDGTEFASDYGPGSEIRRTSVLELALEDPQSPHALELAEIHASLLFPELGPGRLEARLEAFVAELSELCRRHGFHIRPATPNAAIVYSSYGDEDYAVTMHDAGVITLERTLDATAEADGGPPTPR